MSVRKIVWVENIFCLLFYLGLSAVIHLFEVVGNLQPTYMAPCNYTFVKGRERNAVVEIVSANLVLILKSFLFIK